MFRRGEGRRVDVHRRADRHQVDADDLLRVRGREPGGDARAEVAAVGAITREAQFVAHEPVP